jgi:FkbM family methyltransferase
MLESLQKYLQRPRPKNSTTTLAVEPGSRQRPIGDVRSFLEDVRARGFLPRGIIDVGAHRGEWTRMTAAIFPEARILMIEPLDEMEADLRETARDLPNSVYVRAGAGRQTGELYQTIREDLAGSSFLPKIDADKIQAGSQRKTRIVTLDSLTAEHPGFRADLVKLDVQGYELEVLAGAEALLGSTELFILETSLFSSSRRLPSTRDVVAFMAEKGYELYDITGYLRRPLDGALGQIDLAFARRDGILRGSTKWA